MAHRPHSVENKRGQGGWQSQDDRNGAKFRAGKFPMCLVIKDGVLAQFSSNEAPREGKSPSCGDTHMQS